MTKSNKIEKEIKEIDCEIAELQHRKKQLTRTKGKVYCPICKKFYSEEKCRIGIELEGEFTGGFPVTCPKGHE